MEIDRSRVAVHRHQRFELAVDLVPVLRHADILGHREQLADTPGGARRGGKFVSRVRLDDDHIGGMACQRQVAGDRGPITAADDDDFGHFTLGAELLRVVPVAGGPSIIRCHGPTASSN